MKKIIIAMFFVLLISGCNNKINIASYEGNWGDELENLQIFETGENTIDFNYFLYRTMSFYAKDVEIDEDGVGEFNKDNEYDPQGKIYLEKNKVKLVIESHSFPIETEMPIEIEFDTHDRYKVIEKEEIENSINKIIDEGFKEVNTDIFDVEKDGKNYLILKVKDDVRYIDEIAEEKYYAHDDRIYNLDKKEGKLLTIYDFLNNDNQRLKALISYLERKIKAKSSLYNDETGETDPEPHWSFTEYNYENLFMIDEENKTINILCFYPSEAAKVYGNVWIDIPISETRLEENDYN